MVYDYAHQNAMFGPPFGNRAGQARLQAKVLATDGTKLLRCWQMVRDAVKIATHKSQDKDGSMSGSGGGGGYSEPESGCEGLVEKTVLNSPVAAVLGRLKAKDGLQLEVKTSKGSKIVVAVYKKQVAGSITIARLPALIKCIESGRDFVAIVLSVRSGRCEVQVQPADAT